MSKNRYDETIATGKMKPKWIFYLIIISVMMGSLLIGTGTLLFHSLSMGEGWLSLLFGGLFAFSLWASIKIFLLTRNKKPTKIIAVAEEDAYTIYAINEWTEDEKVTKVHYDTIDHLLIGVWTNRGFKGRKSDYVGAQLIIRHPDEDGQWTYTSSIIFDEKVLTMWNERIQAHDIPAFITPFIISNVKRETFDTLIQTIDAQSFDGNFSIKDYFQQQEQLLEWQHK
ncbi:hypothetical protein AB1K83_10630 [Sporosarcina sp. 179-K 3D1 HS]|uniref:hypothetical protein n=1 Tax=Sporosarcina sp. 179-K 3D1 HS TaxID=3232169 RepID=UPI00399FE120